MVRKLSSSVPPLAWAALTALFLFRLAYGLCTEIWFIDQHQIYLIGLKYFATGQWPFFGPDVTAGVQLPGALQGLVVGLPLRFFPFPEAPYLFLAVLSFAGLFLFGLYCSKRLPSFPAWMLWPWLMTAPWVLNWSTNIDNASYLLLGSCLFFIGFLETLPTQTLRLVPAPWANALMGFGLLWNAQFHMSYVVLVPFIAYSFFLQAKPLLERRKGASPSFLGWFLLGAAFPAAFLIPTFLEYGLSASGGTERTVAFNAGNAGAFFTLLARLLSLACAEIPRFIGPRTADRLAFLREHPWTAPFAVTAALLGILQALALLGLWFRKAHPEKSWPGMKRLALAALLILYVLFLFSIKAPASHTYFLVLPLMMLYGFYAFLPWTQKGWFKACWGVLLTANLLFHAGLGVHSFKVRSLYKDRGLFVKAIQEKDFRVLGERRPGTRY